MPQRYSYKSDSPFVHYYYYNNYKNKEIIFIPNNVFEKKKIIKRNLFAFAVTVRRFIGTVPARRRLALNCHKATINYSSYVSPTRATVESL